MIASGHKKITLNNLKAVGKRENMNKKNRKVGYGIAALTLAGFALGSVWASNTEAIPFTPKIVVGTGCPGASVGFVTMTNAAGKTWIVPPTNTASGTFINTSTFTCNVCVTRASDFVSWCGTNSVTFSATNSDSYELTANVKSPTPTNGQPITVQVVWQ